MAGEKESKLIFRERHHLLQHPLSTVSLANHMVKLMQSEGHTGYCSYCSRNSVLAAIVFNQLCHSADLFVGEGSCHRPTSSPLPKISLLLGSQNIYFCRSLVVCRFHLWSRYFSPWLCLYKENWNSTGAAPVVAERVEAVDKNFWFRDCCLLVHIHCEKQDFSILEQL